MEGYQLVSIAPSISVVLLFGFLMFSGFFQAGVESLKPRQLSGPQARVRHKPLTLETVGCLMCLNYANDIK